MLAHVHAHIKLWKKTHPFNLSMNIHFVNNVTEILCQIAISKKEKKRKEKHLSDLLTSQLKAKCSHDERVLENKSPPLWQNSSNQTQN